MTLGPSRPPMLNFPLLLTKMPAFSDGQLNEPRLTFASALYSKSITRVRASGAPVTPQAMSLLPNVEALATKPPAVVSAFAETKFTVPPKPLVETSAQRG